jgi:hypothetical protein
MRRAALGVMVERERVCLVTNLGPKITLARDEGQGINRGNQGLNLIVGPRSTKSTTKIFLPLVCATVSAPLSPPIPPVEIALVLLFSFFLS